MSLLKADVQRYKTLHEKGIGKENPGQDPEPEEVNGWCGAYDKDRDV